MINSISPNVGILTPSFCGTKVTQEIKNTSAANAINEKYNPSCDSIIIHNKPNNSPELSLEEKQTIKHNARKNAAGWSIFGNLISTLYYGLRSDETIAEKYNLDTEKDKKFIKEIRKDQVLWTLPAAFTVGPLGIVSWIYTKCQDSSDIKIKS